MTAAKAVLPWDQFIHEKLICSGFFGGLCLISHQKEIVYVYGELASLSKADIEALFVSFYCKDTDDHYHSLSLDFSTKPCQKTSYRIYQRSLVSVYATPIGGQGNLTISRLPTGVFISLSNKSVLPHKAVTLVEEFTSVLRG